MAVLGMQLFYESNKFITRSVGINLDSRPINNKRARADIEPKRIYYFTCHFVAREEETEFSCVLVPPAGYRVRFPGYPLDASTRLTWEAAHENLDYFRLRRFWIEETL